MCLPLLTKRREGCLFAYACASSLNAIHVVQKCVFMQPLLHFPHFPHVLVLCCQYQKPDNNDSYAFSYSQKPRVSLKRYDTCVYCTSVRHVIIMPSSRDTLTSYCVELILECLILASLSLVAHYHQSVTQPSHK